MGRQKRREPLSCFFFIPIAPCALSVFPLPSLLETQRGLGQREERLTVNGSRTGGAGGLSYLSHYIVLSPS